MQPKLFCEPRLCKAAFRVLDWDDDGYLTRSDLERMLKEDGTRRPEAARAILESADADAQGRIDFKAFCQVMLPRGPDVDPSLAVRVAEYMSKSFV